MNFNVIRAIRSASALGMFEVVPSKATNTRIQLQGKGDGPAVKAAITKAFGVAAVVGPRAPGYSDPLCTFCLKQGFIYLQAVYGEPGSFYLTFEQYDTPLARVVVGGMLNKATKAASVDESIVKDVKLDLSECVKLGVYARKQKKMLAYIDNDKAGIVQFHEDGMSASEIVSMVAELV